MLFNTLLLTGCLLSGQTSFKENKASVSIQAQSGETILFFSIDNDNCKFRQLLELDKPGKRICDLLVFYAKNDQIIICFVELKGGKLTDATEQVIQTYQHFEQVLSKDRKKYNYQSKAFIVCTGSVPKENEQCKKDLEKVFGKNNYAHVHNGIDFGNFLRGISNQNKGKRKREK